MALIEVPENVSLSFVFYFFCYPSPSTMQLRIVVFGITISGGLKFVRKNHFNVNQYSLSCQRTVSYIPIYLSTSIKFLIPYFSRCLEL